VYRGRVRKLTLALAAVAVLAAAVPTGASAASLPVSAFSDTRKVPTRAEALVTVRALRPACPRGGASSGGTLSLRRALSAADGLLRKGVGKRRLARFRTDRRSKKSRKAQELAVGAVAGHNPAGALAGFLAAHARDRRNPLHLLNASVVLTRLGKPREALALITAAERLRAPRRVPMGIGVRALALNNRGFALIALRRYPAAEAALKRAIRAEPLLAEAKLNLALARLCRGRFSQAVDPYIAGQRRSVAGGVEITALQPRAGQALDMSLGRPGEPPKLTLPPTPDDGVASATAWKQFETQRYAQAEQLSATATNALTEMSGFLATRPRLEQSRALEILDLFNERNRQRPEIAAAKQAVLDLELPLRNAYFDWQNEYNQIRSGCQASETTSDGIAACIRAQCVPATVAQHNRWLALIRDSEANTRAFARSLHEYASGLASNLSNPVSQRAIMTAAQHEIMALYYGHVVLEISSRTGAEESMKDECAASGGEATGETEPSDFPFPPGCPPELQAVKIAFSIDFASFNVSCESVSVQVSLPSTLSPFAQVNYNFAGGSTTVFAGARVGGRLPGISANARAGVYMSFDSRGEPTDVGLRGQVSAGGPSLPGVGGPSIGGKADYSLAGTFL
jgi:tetratricopeptide (TPR) repeat protein